jgi:hypothetical protein
LGGCRVARLGASGEHTYVAEELRVRRCAQSKTMFPVGDVGDGAALQRTGRGLRGVVCRQSQEVEGG